VAAFSSFERALQYTTVETTPFVTLALQRIDTDEEGIRKRLRVAIAGIVASGNPPASTNDDNPLGFDNDCLFRLLLHAFHVDRRGSFRDLLDYAATHLSREHSRLEVLHQLADYVFRVDPEVNMGELLFYVLTNHDDEYADNAARLADLRNCVASAGGPPSELFEKYIDLLLATNSPESVVPTDVLAINYIGPYWVEHYDSERLFKALELIRSAETSASGELRSLMVVCRYWQHRILDSRKSREKAKALAESSIEYIGTQLKENPTAYIPHETLRGYENYFRQSHFKVDTIRRPDLKIGRNDLVKVRDQSGKVITVKYKKAEPELRTGKYTLIGKE
jgi:hypothetical protein